MQGRECSRDQSYDGFREAKESDTAGNVPEGAALPPVTHGSDGIGMATPPLTLSEIRFQSVIHRKGEPQ
jgi:hypothetical protein